ncbi:MAG: TIGR01777 family protein [Rickettsiales bacterium]|nr:TIGR01777 family protein [Rickettsiales bacterium]
MRVLISGATGLIGRRLMVELNEPRVLGRDAARARRKLGPVKTFSWQPETAPPAAEPFSGVDVIVHLAGEPVGEGRWTAAKKRAIRNSRVLGTRNLIAAVKSLDQRPKVLISASAAGYYGDRGDQELTETAEPASSFLAEVCREWEAEAMQAEKLGLRVVTARTGLVLAANGGALGRMLLPFRLGMGGQLGHGRQWMPWIHIDDAVGILLHAAKTESLSGPINLVAPNPVTNKTFTRTLGQVLGRPTLLPVPRLALRAAFGEMSHILMESQRALPKAALDSGYDFHHPELRGALESCINGTG